MTLPEIAVVCATLFSPLVALQVSQTIERRREALQRKEQIFKTLMSTRGARVSPAHVEALNMIDVEFYGSSRKLVNIVRAWREYHNELSSPNAMVAAPLWAARRDDLFVELLFQMAQYLHYDFDRTTIKNAAYSPVAHGDAEDDQLAIRKGLADLFRGKRELPISVALKKPVSASLAGPSSPGQSTALTLAPEPEKLREPGA